MQFHVNCNYRRVKINLITDPNQADKLYNLTISGIPTSNYEQYHANPPSVWLGYIASNDVPA